ncbi:MAG TPA: EAL domain-containing protein [Solimonas sp.]|nr:EAL domain-containing protein [Solimonas sp.]
MAEPIEPMTAGDAGVAALQIAAMDAAANAMFICDHAGRICWINRAFTQLYGYESEEICGDTPRRLKSGRQSEAFYRDLWRAIGTGEVWRGQLNNRRKNGELVDVEQTITPIRRDDGRVSHFLAVYEDITHRLHSEKRTAHLALFDSLTGLPNRDNFQRRMSEALARATRTGKALGVMLLDLDHFKAVNDTLGHAAGDELLARVAERMRPCVRESDVVARLSGDEFGILVEDLERPEQALESAQRLLEATQSAYDIDGHPVRIGASVGIAYSTGDGDGPEALLHHADLAMYQAKASGRGRAQFYDAAMDQAARRRYETERALRTALRDDILSIVYQPQVQLDSGEITGGEALLRWTDALRGPVPPDEFVGLAEQTGLIFALNDWVLRRVMREVAAMRQRTLQAVPISINLSAGHFDQQGLADSIERLLLEFQLPATAIRVEITETVMLRSSTTVHENLRGLARLGVALGVDDFGTGYSSLPSLREFPIDYLKLDRSYVGGIGQSTRDEQILRAIIGLARAMDIQVIAEGIETRQHAEFLLAERCPQGQGFRYSPGVPMNDFLALLDIRSLTAREDVRPGAVIHPLRPDRRR